MAPVSYKVEALLSMRGASEIKFEREFIDEMNERAECGMYFCPSSRSHH